MLEYLQYLWNSYGSSPFSVLLELLMIGVGVYTVNRFLRDTGGEKLFKGIVVLLLGFWAISFLTDTFGLERISLLLKYFLVGILVVATVAFQPELRRGLMRLGQTKFSRTEVPRMEHVIEQVLDSVAELTRKKIGAIIAFEREVGLADWIATGTQIEALVTADLLTTIFWHNSPLHDMAVVIRRDRVAAGGVQFPLAEHGEYDRLLGSRHRAAIGFSKETDAVVVVVSEETGHISLGLDGKLARFLTLEQLRQQLRELLITSTTKK
jgi:diadenylate cyclase